MSQHIKIDIKPCLECKAIPGMLIMIVIFVMGVLSIYVHPIKEADFLGYYMAADLFKEGQNPYHAASLLHMEIFPYVYLPYGLCLFYPFTWFGYDAAARIYLTLKLPAILGLLYLWHRFFNLNQYRGLFYAVVPLAFGGALLMDCRYGNISIFEQLLIWLGFYCYYKGRIKGFGVAIILAASLKFVPILLLGLLAARWRKKEMFLGAFFLVMFIVLVAAGAALWPGLLGSFWGNLHSLAGTRGENNADFWSLINDVTRWLQMKTGCQIPAIAPLATYAALAGGILAVSAAMFRRLRLLEQDRANLWRICLTCVTYALVIPRLQPCSYIILIAPAFFILNSSKWVNPILPFYGLLVIFVYKNFQYLGSFLEPFFRVQREYYCLLLACVLFGLCCCCIWREATIKSSLSISKTSNACSID